VGPYDSDGKDFVARFPGKVHGEFPEGILDIGDDALRQRGGQVLFGQDADGPLGLGKKDFFFGRGPGVESCGEDPVMELGIGMLIAGTAEDVVGSDEFRVWEE